MRPGNPLVQHTLRPLPGLFNDRGEVTLRLRPRQRLAGQWRRTPLWLGDAVGHTHTTLMTERHKKRGDGAEDRARSGVFVVTTGHTRLPRAVGRTRRTNL